MFLTEKNAEQLKANVPPELWAEKMQELELKRAAALAPPFIPMKDAWSCLSPKRDPNEGEGGPCWCVNIGELEHCADCGASKPTGDELELAMQDAIERQKKNHAVMIEKMREQMLAKEKANAASTDYEPPTP